MFGILQPLSIFLAIQCTTALTVSPTPDPAAGLGWEEIAKRHTRRTEGGLHLPIVSTKAQGLDRRGTATAATGLGDYIDVIYSVLVTVGSITAPLVLDTGSSDLWIISDACVQGCPSGLPVYLESSFQYSGTDVSLLYGDSTTGTFAQGEIGKDIVGLAGLKLDNQFFAAINRTNTSVAVAGSAGIFGMGFPVNSVIWTNLYNAEVAKGSRVTSRDEPPLQPKPPIKLTSRFSNLESESRPPIKLDSRSPDIAGEGRDDKAARDEPTPLRKPQIKLGSLFPKFNFHIPKFPTLPTLISSSPPSVVSSHTHETRQSSRQQVSTGMETVFQSYNTFGPFIPRLVASNVLAEPMISVTLQRDNVDVGGNVGMLSVGELPSGISNSSMTWVPLRLYKKPEGGLPAPPNSPNEVYPLTWEVMLDGVYLDGQRLPESTLSSPSIGLSALLDTGNSLIRGPADVIGRIHALVGPNGLFSCSTPHTLAFKIGGIMFPVDPRDFVAQSYQDTVNTCSANLASTDAPVVGGYQFGWSLGTPFLKGVLSSFYFGNLTYPSRDPPRMGFLSTVPSDAAQQMINAVNTAATVGGNFPAISEAAPSGTAKGIQTNSKGIAQSTATAKIRNSSSSNNGVPSAARPIETTWAVIFCAVATLMSTALSI